MWSWLEFELAYSDVAVQQINHYPLVTSSNTVMYSYKENITLFDYRKALKRSL